MRNILIAAALISVTGTVGCSSSKSADIETHALYASMTAVATGDGNTKVTAALKVGGVTSNDFLDLTSPDVLIASNGGVAQTMAREDILGAIFYDTTFAVDGSNEAFTIAFDRDVQFVSAPNSTVTLPTPLTITGPAPAASFSRATDPIVITWGASGLTDPMSYLITGDCINLVSAAIPADSGSLTIPAGTIVTPSGQGATTCQITIELDRSRAGTVDPAYGSGGSYTAYQKRTVTVSSAP